MGVIVNVARSTQKFLLSQRHKNMFDVYCVKPIIFWYHFPSISTLWWAKYKTDFPNWGLMLINVSIESHCARWTWSLSQRHVTNAWRELQQEPLGRGGPRQNQHQCNFISINPSKFYFLPLGSISAHWYLAYILMLVTIKNPRWKSGWRENGTIVSVRKAA